MTCTRCSGLLCREHLPGYGRWWWKCCSCGDRIDRVILRNRAEQDAELAARQIDQQRELKEWADWFARVPAVQPS